VYGVQKRRRAKLQHFTLAVADGKEPTNNISPAGSVGFIRRACSYVHIEAHRLYVLLSRHALSCASRAGSMGRAEVWPGDARCGLCEAVFSVVEHGRRYWICGKHGRRTCFHFSAWSNGVCVHAGLERRTLTPVHMLHAMCFPRIYMCV
jgi:hypothetical protein